MALNDKQKLFCDEYLIDFNGKQAAIRAKYSPRSAEMQASRLLAMPEISEYIKTRMKDREERTEITQDMVLSELAKIAFFDARKLFDDEGKPLAINLLDDATAASIVSLDVLEEHIGSGEDKIFLGYTKKYRLADKRAALVDIGKHLGMFIERKEVGQPGDFDKLDDDELEQSIEAAARAINDARSKAKASLSAKGKATPIKRKQTS